MQPIFSRNPDIDKTAFVNWRMSKDDIENLLALADGYLLSAIQLAKDCLLDNQDKKADAFIFPILANANHGVELYLKAIVWVLNHLSGSSAKIEGGHNIRQIYQTAAARIKIYRGHVSQRGFREGMAGLKAYIDELFDKLKADNGNDKMDFSRYPFGRDYADHFYVTEADNVEIDLENFVDHFTIIHNELEDLSAFLYYQELHQEW